MTKLQVNKHIFYFELSSKPHVDTIVIKVSIWRRNYFETIFTSDDLVNIQYAIGKVFGYIERAYSMLEKKIVLKEQIDLTQHLTINLVNLSLK